MKNSGRHVAVSMGSLTVAVVAHAVSPGVGCSTRALCCTVAGAAVAVASNALFRAEKSKAPSDSSSHPKSAQPKSSAALSNVAGSVLICGCSDGCVVGLFTMPSLSSAAGGGLVSWHLKARHAPAALPHPELVQPKRYRQRSGVSTPCSAVVRGALACRMNIAAFLLVNSLPRMAP